MTGGSPLASRWLALLALARAIGCSAVAEKKPPATCAAQATSGCFSARELRIKKHGVVYGMAGQVDGHVTLAVADTTTELAVAPNAGCVTESISLGARFPEYDIGMVTDLIAGQTGTVYRVNLTPRDSGIPKTAIGVVSTAKDAPVLWDYAVAPSSTIPPASGGGIWLKKDQTLVKLTTDGLAALASWQITPGYNLRHVVETPSKTVAVLEHWLPTPRELKFVEIDKTGGTDLSIEPTFGLGQCWRAVSGPNGGTWLICSNDVHNTVGIISLSGNQQAQIWQPVSGISLASRDVAIGVNPSAMTILIAAGGTAKELIWVIRLKWNGQGVQQSYINRSALNFHGHSLAYVLVSQRNPAATGTVEMLAAPVLACDQNVVGQDCTGDLVYLVTADMACIADMELP